jgi:hypothetical protein
MKPHPFAKLFPSLSDEEMTELTSDIKAHGQLNPITLFEGKILDGNHRWRACETLGITPKTVEFHPNGVDPLAFVVSQNAMRRHLSFQQRIVLAVELKLKLEAAPGHKRPNGSGRGSLLAATATKLNERRVIQASLVAKENPVLWEKIKKGTATVSSAYREIKGYTPKAEKHMPPKLFNEWDAFRQIGNTVNQLGWNVAMIGKAKAWKVQFFEKEMKPWEDIKEWESVRPAVQAALQLIFT